MFDIIEKPASWRLRLSVFEFDIVYRTGLEHQAVDTISRLSSYRTDKTKRAEDIPVLGKTTNIASADEAGQEQEAWDNFEKSTNQEFNPYLPGLYAVPNQVDETETDIPRLREFS